VAAPLPVHLSPLLHVAELHEECVEFSFGVHDWRLRARINGLSTQRDAPRPPGRTTTRVHVPKPYETRKMLDGT
jgi:hypothetical protein